MNDAVEAAEGLGPYGWGIIIVVLGLIAWRYIATRRSGGSFISGGGSGDRGKNNPKSNRN